MCVLVNGETPQLFLESSEVGVKCSDWLLPAIDRVLTAAHRKLESLDAIAFGAGPGSFTGVRTACAAAQALAYAQDKPLIGVDVLHALAVLAATERPEQAHFTVVLDARMGELYVAVFSKDSDGSLRAEAPTRLIAAKAAPEIRTKTWLIGSGAAHCSPPLGGEGQGERVSALQTNLASAHSPSPQPPEGGSQTTSLETRWAEGVARLALQLGAAAVIDPLTAEPLYVRNNVAQTEAERAALRHAATSIPAL